MSKCPNRSSSNKTRQDAAVPRAALPPDRPRRPLGLRPASDDLAAPEATGEPRSEPQRSDPAAREPLYVDAHGTEYRDPAAPLISESNDLVYRALDETCGHFERKIAGLENAIGTLKNENQSLRLILENLRITQRGERGIDGDRGPPGRDGRDGVGQVGPAAPRGDKGHDAPRIVAWEINNSEFVAYPLLSTGRKGPGLHLRAMFEAFSDAIDGDDDAAQADAARAPREATEREASRVRAGLPPR